MIKPAGNGLPRRFVTFRNTDHFFRKFDGLGVSHAVLMNIRRRFGVNMIVIIMDWGDRQERFITTTDKFLEEGEYYTDKESDTQRILPLSKLGQRTIDSWVKK